MNPLKWLKNRFIKKRQSQSRGRRDYGRPTNSSSRQRGGFRDRSRNGWFGRLRDKIFKRNRNQSAFRGRAKKFSARRRRRKWRERFAKFSKFLSNHWLKFAVGLGVIVFIAGGYGLNQILQRTDYFTVVDIQVRGNDYLEEQQLNDYLEEYKGKSLLEIDASHINMKLAEDFTYIKQAYTRKVLPDKIEVEIVERFPLFSYVNLSGAYLVDEEGLILQRLDYEQTTPLSPEEVDIVNGYVDPNSPQLINRFVQQLSEEDLEVAVESIETDQQAESIDMEQDVAESDQQDGAQANPEDVDEGVTPQQLWEQADPEVRERIINEFTEEYRVRVQGRFGRFSQQVNELELQVPQVSDLSAVVYDVGNSLDPVQFEFLQEVLAFFQDRELKVSTIGWQANYRIVVELDSGTSILFTLNKGLDSQLDWLETVSRVENLADLNEVDLRGDENLSVR